MESKSTIEITWLGWSSFKVKTGGKVIYFDPVLGNYDESADLVLISHSHFDHSDPDVLSRIRKPETVVLTSKQNSDAVKGIGLAPGESHLVDSIKVDACYAYNIIRMRSPGVPFHPKGFGLGWIVESGGKRIYHMGDTELVPEMSDLPPIDILLIPISGFYVMDSEEAIKAIKVIKPKHVIPMHFGTVKIGKDDTHINLPADAAEFANKLKGITDVKVLTPGETITF